LKEARKELVDLNEPYDDDEKAEEGSAVFNSANNFKLVTGSGHLKITEPPRDELFGLTFRRALKVYRKVEFMEEYTE